MSRFRLFQFQATVFRENCYNFLSSVIIVALDDGEAKWVASGGDRYTVVVKRIRYPLPGILRQMAVTPWVRWSGRPGRRL